MTEAELVSKCQQQVPRLRNAIDKANRIAPLGMTDGICYRIG